MITCNLHRQVVSLRGVLLLLNCVPIHGRLDCFSHSITMETFTPTWCKTAKIHPSTFKTYGVFTLPDIKIDTETGL